MSDSITFERIAITFSISWSMSIFTPLAVVCGDGIT